MLRPLPTLAFLTLVTSLFACPANAQDTYKWCIEASGSSADWDHCVFEPAASQPCANGTVYTTVTEAVAAAALTDPASTGGRPWQNLFCIRTAGRHSEQIVFDNSDGVLGTEVAFSLNPGEANFCPATAGPVGGDGAAFRADREMDDAQWSFVHNTVNQSSGLLFAMTGVGSDGGLAMGKNLVWGSKNPVRGS